jgi:hypothetical protein
MVAKHRSDITHDPSSGKVVYQRDISWNTQKKPWVHPLGYSATIVELQEYTGNYWIGPNDSVERENPGILAYYPETFKGDADIADVINKLREKFVSSIHDTATNANNLLEVGQNIGSVVSKVQAIALSVQRIRKGDVTGAAKALGVSISEKKRKAIIKRGKQASDAWLELHFGWEPLVQDIGNNIENIQGTGKAPTGNTKLRLVSKSGTGGQSYFKDPADHDYERNTKATTWVTAARMGALVSVENPNLALANQMGFVNPLSVAWEAVPFSFVVDWFANVGQCLAAMTEFAGYNIEDAYTTTFRKTNTTFLNATDDSVYWVIRQYNKASSQAISVNRSLGIPGPTLKFKPFKGFSPTRGATAISLLVQQFANINKVR